MKLESKVEMSLFGIAVFTRSISFKQCSVSGPAKFQKLSIFFFFSTGVMLSLMPGEKSDCKIQTFVLENCLLAWPVE